ncbi:TIGR03086 family metal-binding protein [Actinoplanes sp. NPDC024001]|uniref:TIGR03086 family metal-binding protein n=1 Tax=Actinoplanes sp. NPDC024001 TaxID=3154598 RepID=UPI0033D56B09
MLTINDDLRAADATAVRATIDLVSRVTEADLGRATPCAGWDLAALLEHMTEQHHVFAAAARGAAAADGGDYAAAGGDDYAAAAEDVLAAFAGEGVLDRPFLLPEIGRPVPGRMAIGFHLVDYLVHGWDVARTIGAPYRPGPDLLAPVLAIARAVPDGPERRAPESPFAPARPVPDGADALTEILLLLGRDPDQPLR